jgi:putative SOS response-associated peptidase YedK
MTTHYETLHQVDAYRDAFGVAPPAEPGERHMWPRKPGYFIQAAPAAEALADEAAAEAGDRTAAAGEPAVALESAAEDIDGQAASSPTAPPTAAGATAPGRMLVKAQWGLVPHWVKSASDGKLRAPKLVNARSETVSTTHAFRDAWLQGQRCIVPLTAFYEDDWREGKAVPTRIARVDGEPMGAAGLWARWTGPDGESLLSFTLLTVNANNHALLRRYQPAGAEKRMPVLLNPGAYDAWLGVRFEKAKDFMRQYPANWLLANPVEGGGKFKG